jgi:hypothetical protein
MGLFGKEEAAEATVAGRALRCEICHHTKFWQRKGQIHGAVVAFFDLEWLGPTATCLVCEHCGYVHWFLPTE